MTAFDQAWDLAKAPFVIDDDSDFDRLYQGGKEGDSDSGYWPMSHVEALIYALMGSDVGDNATMRQGIPQIRVAYDPDQTHRLDSDPETTMVGMHPNLPHEFQSREETAKDIVGLLAQLKEDSYDPNDDKDGWNESQSDIAPFLDTSARLFSNKKRIAHIEEQLRRLRE